MLNYYYLYSIIATIVTLLYLIPLSSLNRPLSPFFVALIIISVIISLILGYVFKNNFIYRDLVYKKNKNNILPAALITAGSVIEFIYLKNIPLCSVTMLHKIKYAELTTIPFYHVLICMFALYYSVEYLYKAVSYKEERITNIICYLLINVLMILYNMRSFLLISLFITANFIIAKRRYIGKKISLKLIVASIVFILALFYGFGCFGNLREGQSIDNTLYMEKIGMYKAWPNLIPKQYMWTYTYITSPLANLNNSILHYDNNHSISGFITQLLPNTIGSRLFDDDSTKKCILIRGDLNVGTGYCGSVVNYGYIGLIVFWIITMLFPILFFKYNKLSYKTKEYFIFLAIYNACISFMCVDNMFVYGGTSAPLWLSTLLLINKIKVKW